MASVGTRGRRAAVGLAAGLGVLSLTFIGEAARAGCCDVVKVDAEIPAGPVRVCEPDASGDGCGAVLFEDTLALGAHASVCSAGETVLYQETDPATGTWMPPVTAVCDGADVEL